MPVENCSASALTKKFENDYDFTARRVDIGGWGKRLGYLCFLDGLVSGESVAREVILPLTDKERFPEGEDIGETVRKITDGVVYCYTPKRRCDMETVSQDVLSGFCALFIDGFDGCITFETKTSTARSVDAPREEKVVKGSKDAFVEILKTNTMLVRRKLRSSALKIEKVEMCGASVTVLYIKGLAEESLVGDIKMRLSSIKSCGLLTSADIENGLLGENSSPFPMLITTERPDKFCMNLLEGRVGVLCDGLPIGYLAPATFSQFFKVPEDKANHYLVASCLTALRYFALAVTLLLPAFYVAVAMYHREMIPTKLMQSIIASKESVPFPTAFEVVAMLISFELLQEAGLRLPNPIGETVSIIGALIVGQSAVEAKVVSPVVIIVVAMAGIAGYTMPNQDMAAAIRITRFLFVIAAVLFGMPGLALAFCMLLFRLCSLESFGTPYASPFSSGIGKRILRAVTQERECGTRPDPDIAGDGNG